MRCQSSGYQAPHRGTARFHIFGNDGIDFFIGGPNVFQADFLAVCNAGYDRVFNISGLPHQRVSSDQQTKREACFTLDGHGRQWSLPDNTAVAYRRSRWFLHRFSDPALPLMPLQSGQKRRPPKPSFPFQAAVRDVYVPMFDTGTAAALILAIGVNVTISAAHLAGKAHWQEAHIWAVAVAGDFARQHHLRPLAIQPWFLASSAAGDIVAKMGFAWRRPTLATAATAVSNAQPLPIQAVWNGEKQMAVYARFAGTRWTRRPNHAHVGKPSKPMNRKQPLIIYPVRTTVKSSSRGWAAKRRASPVNGSDCCLVLLAYSTVARPVVLCVLPLSVPTQVSVAVLWRLDVCGYRRGRWTISGSLTSWFAVHGVTVWASVACRLATADERSVHRRAACVQSDFGCWDFGRARGWELVWPARHFLWEWFVTWCRCHRESRPHFQNRGFVHWWSGKRSSLRRSSISRFWWCDQIKRLHPPPSGRR